VILSASWENESNPNHRFNFNNNPAGPASRQGTFDGFEVTPNNENFDFSGSWSENGSIQMTVERATNVTYRGTISSNGRRIVFTTPSSLILVPQVP
jgi:hypothetical protein